MALAGKKMLAKMLFLQNTAELFAGFQTLFQRQETLVHIVYLESFSLVRKLLSRLTKHEVFPFLSGPELKCLDMGAPEGLKQVPEMGLDTEQEMHNWNLQDKKFFRVGMPGMPTSVLQDTF